MKLRTLRFFGAAVLGIGLLMVSAPGALGQMRPGMQSQQQPGMQQNNSQRNNAMQNRQMSQQSSAEASFIANMRRNSKVETDLSKMALKNSGSDQVKDFAKQIIAENRKNDSAMNSANPQMQEMSFPAPVPSETKKAEKQMKKMTGPDFDKLYIGQMDGYIKDDQQLTRKASSELNSGNMGSLTMQMRNTADSRIQQLTQVAKSENLTLR